MARERVVITGLGVFCGAAQNIPDFRRAILEGKSGVSPVDLFDVSAFPARIAVQVKGYDPESRFGRRRAAKLSRADQFGLIAAGEALARTIAPSGARIDTTSSRRPCTRIAGRGLPQRQGSGETSTLSPRS